MSIRASVWYDAECNICGNRYELSFETSAAVLDDIVTWDWGFAAGGKFVACPDHLRMGHPDGGPWCYSCHDGETELYAGNCVPCWGVAFGGDR